MPAGICSIALCPWVFSCGLSPGQTKNEGATSLCTDLLGLLASNVSALDAGLWVLGEVLKKRHHNLVFVHVYPCRILKIIILLLGQKSLGFALAPDAVSRCMKMLRCRYPTADRKQRASRSLL
jgi:hypothetical protein